ncbi:MAG: hypothetical protein GXP62_10795 [Oligoflexia bacterium]|nr:hypothetical protein [Oligoflexia bacterium]
MNPLRLVLAVVAVGILLGLVGWSLGAGRVEGPARVEAATEFRVTDQGDGRVRWTLLDGRVPGGPVVVSDGVLQADRGDPVVVEVAKGLKAGQHVDIGADVAHVTATRQDEDVSALQAQLQAVHAEQALLLAGGRPEAVARARQAVDVAEASLARSQADLAHVRDLSEAGAVGAWSAEDAGLQVAVQRADRDLAIASLAEVRKPARAEEIAQLQARQAVIQARLNAAQSRLNGQALTSPISGTVTMTAGEDIISTVVSIIGEDTPVLQIAVSEAARDLVSLGDPVRFTPTASAGSPVDGRVLAVGSMAGTLGGEPVVWLVATLDQPMAVGATGRARVLGTGSFSFGLGVL